MREAVAARGRGLGVFWMCWATYVAAYLCRLNFSTVLAKLEPALGVDKTGLGLVGSVFFVVYATGQLVNGLVGDRVSPHAFVAVGIGGTAALNLIIGAAGSYPVLVGCWALNGCFQSMFWGPMMRILSARYGGESRANISTGMSTSMVMGYMLSWTVLAGALAEASWRLYFLVPAALCAVMLAAWLLAARRMAPAAGAGQAAGAPAYKAPGLRETLRTIVRDRLYGTALVCVCLGLVKESVNLWAPVILVSAFGFDVASSFGYLLLIPVANLGGILLARLLCARYAARVHRAVVVLFGALALAAAVLFLLSGTAPLLCLVLLALISAMTFGINSILLAFIPISYAGKGMVSTLVGVFDFSSYLGAAVSAFALGMVLGGDDWRLAPLIWLAAAVAAVALSLGQGRRPAAQGV